MGAQRRGLVQAACRERLCIPTYLLIYLVAARWMMFVIVFLKLVNQLGGCRRLARVPPLLGRGRQKQVCMHDHNTYTQAVGRLAMQDAA